MFRCQNKSCNKMVPLNQPQNRVITERRNMVYEKQIRKYGKVVDTEEVKGWEIVKEISVCPKCFQKLTGMKPKLVTTKSRSTPQKPHVPNPRRRKQNPRTRKPQAQTGDYTQTRKPVVEKVNQIPMVKG